MNLMILYISFCLFVVPKFNYYQFYFFSLGNLHFNFPLFNNEDRVIAPEFHSRQTMQAYQLNKNGIVFSSRI